MSFQINKTAATAWHANEDMAQDQRRQKKKNQWRQNKERG
jgi:hypothetical protein